MSLCGMRFVQELSIWGYALLRTINGPYAQYLQGEYVARTSAGLHVLHITALCTESYCIVALRIVGSVRSSTCFLCFARSCFCTHCSRTVLDETFAAVAAFSQLCYAVPILCVRIHLVTVLIAVFFTTSE